VEPQLRAAAATACTLLLLPAAERALCWLSPMTAIAARAATAGVRNRKPTLAWMRGRDHLRAQGVLTTQEAGAPPGRAGLKNLQS
jgi:hypothetical protein